MLFRGPFVLLLLVLLCASAEAATIHAEFTSSQADTSGPHHIQGRLAVLLLLETFDEEGKRDADPKFQLNASRLLVEKDYTNNSLDTGPVAFNLRGPPFESGSDPFHYENATVTGLRNREGYRMMVLVNGTAPEVRFEAECTTVLPSTRAEVEQDPMASNRQTIRVPVDSAVNLTSCSSDGKITITGTFQMALWEWDAQLFVDGQRQDLQNGRKEHPLIPGQAATSTVEHYLLAKDATLEIPAKRGAYELYAEAARMQPQGAVHVSLQAPDGTLDIPHDRLTLDGRTLEVEGQVQLGLQAKNEKSFRVTLTGDAEQIHVAGQAVTVPIAGPGWSLNPWPVLLVLLLVALIAGAAYIIQSPRAVYKELEALGSRHLDEKSSTSWRFRYAAAYFALANYALEDGHLRRASLWSTLACRLRPGNEPYIRLREEVRRKHA